MTKSGPPETYTLEAEIRKLDYLNLICLVIPAEVVELYGSMKNQRFRVHIGELTYQSGFMPIGDGCAGINLNKSRLKAIHAELGQWVQITLERDHSEFGFDIPESLQAVFDQDEEALQRFLGLKPGMQRYIIHYISSAKRVETQIERSLMLMKNLKNCILGKENFRQLLGKS